MHLNVPAALLSEPSLREENIAGHARPADNGIDLRHLRYFVGVAEHLHFGRAASALYITQPPLSRQIRDLEHRLGVTLFNRSGRKVALTAPGRVLLAESRRLFEEISISLCRVRRAAESSRTATISRHVTAGG